MVSATKSSLRFVLVTFFLPPSQASNTNTYTNTNTRALNTTHINIPTALDLLQPVS